MLLPKKLGPVTLMRSLGSDGVTEAFVGILDEPAGEQVVVRRLLPYVVRDASRLASVEARAQDLAAVRHPILVPVLRTEKVDDERLIVQEHVDGVSITEVLDWCRREGQTLPHNVFLNLATQICNGLEALHGRPGKATGSEHVLHLGLGPDAVIVTPEGRLVVSEYGLVRSPTSLPSGGAAEAASARLANLAPEQTHPDQKLSPASDIFALGSLLFEMLTLESLFRRESSLQTIHAVRRAEVSAALQEVKRVLPGLDKVLYRALSLNPRHRYQRAFVLREDIRGLMAGFSFTRINEETIAFLAPLFAARGAAERGAPMADAGGDTTGDMLAQVAGTDAAADSTMGFIRRASGDRQTLVPPQEEALEGLEMWSEVPTSVDPSDPAAIPSQTPPPAHRAGSKPIEDSLTGSSMFDSPPPTGDKTTWVRRDGSPPEDGFDGDVATDVSSTPTPRLATREEAEALGIKRVATPVPAGDATAPPVPEQAPRPEPLPGTDLRPTRPSSAAEPAFSGSISDAPTPSSEDAARAVPPPAPQADPPRKKRGATYVPDEVTVPDVANAEPEYKPRSGRGMAIVAAAVAVFVVVLLCGGGLIYGAQLLNRGGSTTGPPLAAGTPDAETPAVVTPQAPTAAPEAPVTAPPETDPTPAVAVATPPTADTPDAPTPATTPPATASNRTTTPSNRTATTPSRTTTASNRTTTASNRTTTTPNRTTTTPNRTTTTPNRTTTNRVTSTRPPEPPKTSIPSDGGLIDASEANLEVSEIAPSTLDALASKARSGALSASERLQLQMTEVSDPSHTRANVLLYEDAKARGNSADQRKHLDAILAKAENKYNAAYLAEGAHLDIAQKNYDRALSRAGTAERYWGRLPSKLVFSRKTMIYEAQAAAWQGKFYESGGSDMGALSSAISSWEKYQRHVTGKSRSDLSRIADEQLAKLYDARRRLE